MTKTSKDDALDFLLLYNPKAGRGKTRKQLAYVCKSLDEMAVRYRVLEGHDLAQLEHQSQTYQAKGYIAFGGDGTVHHLAKLCLQRQLTLAIIPAGSGDDLANHLGLGSIDAALQCIKAQKRSHIDVGRVNGEYFFNATSSGFDASVGAALQKIPFVIKGKWAYYSAIALSLPRLRNQELSLWLDHSLAYQGPSLLCSIQNGSRTGSGYYYAPHASVDDGVFDVVWTHELSLRQTLQVMPKVRQGKHIGGGEVEVARAASIKVLWEEPRQGHADGELLTSAKSFEIEVLPRALEIYMGNPSRSTS